MKVACIIAAAGKGKRLNKKKEKAFVKIGREPIIIHTLRAVSGCSFIDDIIVCVPGKRIDKCRNLIRKCGITKVRSVVRGGRRRSDSVKTGLREAGDADIVLVHDGARPFADRGLIKKVFSAAGKFAAAVPAVTPRHTIKISGRNGFIFKTPDRKLLREIQTPQGFKKSLITAAYKRAPSSEVTDDAGLVERLGNKVKIVKGSYGNIKITTPEDLALAEALLKKKKKKR